MKESKIKIWLKSKVQVAKDVVVPALCAIIPGVIIGGSIVAIRDSYKLDKLAKDHGKLVNTFNNNVDKHNDFVDWTHEEVEKLTRQNNELLERALRESEGKAS